VSEPPGSQQFSAQVVRCTRAHQLLAPGDPDIIDAHSAGELDGQQAARPHRQAALRLEAAASPTHLNEPDRNGSDQRGHVLVARAVTAVELFNTHGLYPPT
jgi:hypothetical protein